MLSFFFARFFFLFPFLFKFILLFLFNSLFWAIFGLYGVSSLIDTLGWVRLLFGFLEEVIYGIIELYFLF
jgi:hypothetical protein